MPSALGRLLVSLLGAAFLAAPPAFAASIEVLAATRAVGADASSTTGAEFSAQTEADAQEPQDPEGTVLAVGAAAETRGSSAQAGATLDSSLTPGSLVAAGDSFATTDIATVPGEPDASATGDVLLDIDFRVDETSTWVLTGMLSASASGLADGFALLEIFVSMGEAVFVADTFSDGSPVTIDEQLVLEAGTDYTLIGVADSLGDLGGDATAAFAFELRPIPEPATALALALGVGALAAARRRL